MHSYTIVPKSNTLPSGDSMVPKSTFAVCTSQSSNLGAAPVALPKSKFNGSINTLKSRTSMPYTLPASGPLNCVPVIVPPLFTS